ncbi:MAG: S1 RNA-binding domain-containing protein [Candidatus Aenigmarchaeota archaeon]|nr:S1 RNA-binding domain-containing protein [Candidatus Aenigmarchaeota archaeon]
MVKRKGLPEIDDNVLVTISNITPYSATCTLDEYGNAEGMIHASEVSGKWIKDIRKFIKTGRQYVGKVLDVDTSKNFVTLSLKRLSKRAREMKMEDYKKEQKAEKILEQIAKKKGIKLNEAYEKIGYLLQEKYGDMFIAFEQVTKSPDLLIDKGISKDWVQIIKEVTEENTQRKEVKIKAEIEMKFYTPDGIDRIKKILTDLTNKYKFNVKYISAPLYIIEVKTDNPKLAQKNLREQLTTAFAGIKDGEVAFKIIGEK